MASSSRGDSWKRGRGNWRGRGFRGNNSSSWRGRASWNARDRGGDVRPPAGTSNQYAQSPAPKRRRTTQTTLVNCPYKHWKTYLPDEGQIAVCLKHYVSIIAPFADYISDQSGVGRKVASFLAHFKRNLSSYVHVIKL